MVLIKQWSQFEQMTQRVIDALTLSYRMIRDLDAQANHALAVLLGMLD